MTNFAKIIRLKTIKIPSTKYQIPGPDRLETYRAYNLKLYTGNEWCITPNKSRQGGLKQIPMTQIQKSKHRIRLPLRPTASSSARRILRRGALRFWRMFWSLSIEIWDLFVIWCLRFEILLYYKDLLMQPVEILLWRHPGRDRPHLTCLLSATIFFFITKSVRACDYIGRYWSGIGGIQTTLVIRRRCHGNKRLPHKKEDIYKQAKS